MFPGVREYDCIYEKSSIKPFVSSGGRCVKSEKLPQVMSLESAPVGAEDYKFENERSDVS